MNNLPQKQEQQLPAAPIQGMSFELQLQRAELLAKSSIIPKEFIGKPGDCFIVMELADRLGIPAFTMFQNVDVVYGRVGVRGSFARALCQQKTQGFVDDGFEVEGKLPANFSNFDPEKSDYRVRYYIDKVTAATGEIKRVFGPWIGPALAKSMGWWNKASKTSGAESSFWCKNPSMCERMCKFRAVSWYVKDEDPNLLVGLPLAEELHDYDAIDITPEKGMTAAQKAFLSAPAAEVEKEVKEEVKPTPQITPDAAKALKDFAHLCGYKITEVLPAILQRDIKSLSEMTKEEFSAVEQWLDANKKS